MLYGGLASWLAGIRAQVYAMSGLGYVFVDESAKARAIHFAASQSFRPVQAQPDARRHLFQDPSDLRALVAMGVARPKTVLIRGSGVDVDRFTPRPEPPGPADRAVRRAADVARKGAGEFAAAARRLHRRPAS
ncbi:MAG: hypothetical protein R2708_25065 [Vicinamibacterales bacterium]